ncbi:hypothetical protein A9174_12720 [Mesorhizobium loti NZP2037]|nr:hypothetical protein A9174_12720 [Mesorhizobium loti NZP2037]
MGMKPAALAYILYKLPAGAKYKSFEIEKKSGGVRKIMAPEPRLKMLQRRLADLLLACQSEIEASMKIKDDCALAHGFKPRLSIFTNAEKHRNRRWVFNADIEDFFPTINFGRVYGFFQKNHHFALPKPVATIIAQIACHENQLPQGSPCSPVISNIIAHILDIHLNDLAYRHNCTYTRYADDLTFSTNEKQFPRAIAKRQVGDIHEWIPGSGLKKALKSNGFKLNGSKTRMQYCDSRQEVTGLVTNEKVNVKQQYYKQARAMTRELVTGKKPFVTVAGKKVEVARDHLRGMLNFIYFIKSKENKRIGFTFDKENDKLPTFHAIYKQFLDYIWFYGIDEPTIICEGKTDNIYLKAAIKARAAHFPELVKTVEGVTKIRPRFFKYSDTAAELQDLSGGTGELNNLLAHYRNRITTFRGGANQPVIIIVDNDSGATAIFSHIYNILNPKIKSTGGKKGGATPAAPVDGSEQFYYLYENLYIVPVPKVAGAETPIERLFDPKLLKTVWNGKQLDLTGDKDPAKYYFKNDFAVHVVKEGGAGVKFDDFDPLLSAIVAVKADYAKRVALLAAVA